MKKRGILPEPEPIGGKRRYAPDALRILNAVHVAKQAGFTRAEIKTLCEALEDGRPMGVDVRELAERRLAEVDGQ